ncbi:MAG: class I SAM-dependent methyltransferase [Acidimicrobiales bacterium]|nr:class I SAM-dependent methyltransferase [Acidimicrobiales bacterium]
MTVEKFLNQTYRLETQEETLAHYEAWADTYDEEITENNYAQPSRCASALAQFSTIDEINVLDIGCGSGLSGLALNDFGFKNIDGCDFSPSMLEKAKSTNVYQKLFLADINEELDIEEETYDAVCAVGVLAFAHVRTEALRQMLRVVKSKGLLVIGLNEHYWEGGSVGEKIRELSEGDETELLFEEYGDHLPGADIGGWVAVLRKK